MNKQERAQAREDMSRPVFIHVCKDGTVTYRRAHEKVFNGRALPVFTVDNEEQAHDIQVRFCRRQYKEHPLIPGKPWYVLNDFKGEVSDLLRITDMFREFYNEYLRDKDKDIRMSVLLAEWLTRNLLTDSQLDVTLPREFGVRQSPRQLFSTLVSAAKKVSERKEKPHG